MTVVNVIQAKKQIMNKFVSLTVLSYMQIHRLYVNCVLCDLTLNNNHSIEYVRKYKYMLLSIMKRVRPQVKVRLTED